MKKDKFGQLEATQFQFNEQLDIYVSEKSGATHSEILRFLRDHNFSKQSKDSINICEFGGGGGILLREIEHILGMECISLHLVEITDAYQSELASNSIQFVNDSLLNPELPGNTYDIVLVRDVLHHLVADNLKKTLENQRMAITNLVRVVKPGGLILIEEEVNRSALSSTIVYYLSLLAANLNIRSQIFQITPNTIVHFLTAKEIKKRVESSAGLGSVVDEKLTMWAMPWYWKATILMSKVGHYFIVVRKAVS